MSIVEKILGEAITIDLEVGDEIKTGKFRNKRVTVKKIGTDEHGSPTVNGKSILSIRIPKLEEGKSTKAIKQINLIDNILKEAISPRSLPSNISSILKRFGAKKVLGSGMNGVAWETKNGQVLKLTDDVYEINAMANIMKKKMKHFVKVYAIYRLSIPVDDTDEESYDDAREDKDIWLLLMEKVQTLNPKEQSMYLICEDIYRIYLKSLKDEVNYKKFIPSLAAGKLSLPNQYNKLELKIKGLNIEEMNNLFIQYYGLMQEATKNSLGDFHGENVGWRKDGTLVAFDSRTLFPMKASSKNFIKMY